MSIVIHANCLLLAFSTLASTRTVWSASWRSLIAQCGKLHKKILGVGFTVQCNMMQTVMLATQRILFYHLPLFLVDLWKMLHCGMWWFIEGWIPGVKTIKNPILKDRWGHKYPLINEWFWMLSSSLSSVRKNCSFYFDIKTLTLCLMFESKNFSKVLMILL